MTASTQLRALEGEIESPLENPLFSDSDVVEAYYKIAHKLLTIAKELEKALAHEVEERDHARQELAECNRDTSAEIQSLRTENATLKRRLDEAIIGLQVAHERFDRLPMQADMEDAMWCAISCEEIEHCLTRITEIDKL